MAEDDMESDASVGSKRTMADMEETPVVVLHQQQQEFSNSSPREDQEFTEDIPSPSKKVKSSLTQLEDNQEAFASSGHEKILLCDLVSGSFVSDGNGEHVARKVEDFNVQSQETEDNQELLGSSGQEKVVVCDLVSGPSVCDGSSYDLSRNVESFDVQLQQAKNFVFDGEDDKGEIEGTVNNVQSKLGFSGVQEYDNNGVLGECKTVEVEMDAVTEEKKETLLEVKKKQLLAKVEAGSLFKEKNNVESSLDFDTTAGILGGLKGIDVSIKSSLKVEVIDDTALIGNLAVAKTGNGGVKNADRHVNKNEKREANGKKAKRSRKRVKDVKKGLVISDRETKITHVGKDLNNIVQIGQYQTGGQKNGDQIRKYSREEMEALRFVNIVQQRKLWRDIYTGLGDAAIKDYDDLASSRHYQKKVRMNFDPRKHFGRKEDASGILGKVCSGNGDPLGKMGEDEVENENLLDPSCSESIGGEDSYMEGESCEEEDSDEDYASIQRPAFLVEGEPDFDSGPPEDGLEYLRRVRWEAAHIPNVKVAKLDKSKNKEQSIYLPQIPEIAKCPEHLQPLKQWEDAFLTEFSELRTYLSCNGDSSSEISCMLQGMAIAHEQKTSSYQLDENTILEKFSNLGTDELYSYELAGDSCLDDTIDQVSMASMANAEDCKISAHSQKTLPVGDCSCNYPKLCTILAMDAVARVSMLRKRISLAETMDTISKNDCVWLFALSAAVDTPLDADTCAALRCLLRKCSSVRAAKSELDDEVIMLNILITISGRYFGQSES